MRCVLRGRGEEKVTTGWWITRHEKSQAEHKAGMRIQVDSDQWPRSNAGPPRSISNNCPRHRAGYIMTFE